MDNPGSRAEQGKSLERFRRALAGLPVEQREAFVLREESGLSLADIAAVTGVTPETAKSRLRYAVNKLRIMLSDMETSA
jgi:RNA polymerase sigma-70 factor (ECF subfamily)